MSDGKKQARVNVYYRKNPCNYCHAWKYDGKQKMYYSSFITSCCFDVPSTADIDWLIKAASIMLTTGIIIGGMMSSGYFFIFLIVLIAAHIIAAIYKKIKMFLK